MGASKNTGEQGQSKISTMERKKAGKENKDAMGWW